MGSKRLPGKVLLNLNGRPLLEHVINSCKRCFPKIDIVIATSLLKEDDDIVSFGEINQIKVFRGDELDVLERYRKVLSLYPHKRIFIRATADNPIKAGPLNRMLLLLHDIFGLDYSGIDKLAFNCFEFMSRKAIEESAEVVNAYAHEHVTPLMYSNKNPLRLRRIIYPRFFLFAAQEGITIDTQADYHKAKIFMGERNTVNNN